ncbi:MAG: hypothetical protein D6768_09805 [Chloroflexi bacterium]|nr:MAG: hypothetical protein D6768_09805 [Chloroflexota bacterium]
MRAALLDKNLQLQMIDTDPPTIQADDQLLIRVKAVGICGSEVHAMHGTHPTRIAPVILGHEVAGDVVAVGAGVTAFKPGDRVVIDPQWTCGECEYCRAGEINFCPTKKVLGTPKWPGGFGQLVVAPQRSVFALPDNLTYEQGAMLEPLSVDVHVAHKARLQPGESVVILGTGSIGGLLSGVCRAMGAGPIITADLHQHCLDAARERLGATHDFLLPNANFAARVKEITGGGADVIFVAGDEEKLVNLAIEIAGNKGRIVIVALLREAPLQINAYDVIAKELEIIGTTMVNHQDVRNAISLAETGQVDVLGIVTHRLPIEQVQRGMELVDTKADGAIKVVLSFDNGG